MSENKIGTMLSFIKHCDYGICAILDGTYTNHEFDGKVYDVV